MGQRIPKVESVVQHVVATEIANVLGPDSARVTVTGVDVSPDMHNAIVWIGILGDDASQERIMSHLNAAIGELKRALAAKMTTKYIPRLDLRSDGGGKRAAEIERLLKS